jgi:hypothetical protein
MLVKILIAVHKYMLVPAICVLLFNIVNYAFLFYVYVAGPGGCAV